MDAMADACCGRKPLCPMHAGINPCLSRFFAMEIVICKLTIVLSGEFVLMEIALQCVHCTTELIAIVITVVRLITIHCSHVIQLTLLWHVQLFRILLEV